MDQAAGRYREEGRAIAEIETDKVNVDIEAEWDGTWPGLVAGAGDVVPVGSPIAVIARPGEQSRRTRHRHGAASAARGGDRRRVPCRLARSRPRHGARIRGRGPTRSGPRLAARAATWPSSTASPCSRSRAPVRTAASPKGTSRPRWRPARRPRRPAQAPAPAPRRPGPATSPLSRMRQTIARRMTESKQHTPHIYLTVSIRDGHRAWTLRRQLNERLDDPSEGFGQRPRRQGGGAGAGAGIRT